VTPDIVAARDHIRGVIRADLLSRPALAGPEMRGAVHELVALSAGRALIDKIVRETGCHPGDVMAHHDLTQRVTVSLVGIGTDLIADTVAEEVLRDALATRNATLALMPVAGSA
jgi:hypothetical protein